MRMEGKHTGVVGRVASLLLLCSMLLTSCADLVVDRDLDTGYFPLITFIRAEADRLGADNTAMDRTVNWNGATETQTIGAQADPEYWKQELKIFVTAAIDRPALMGLYRIDTLFIDTDSLTRVSYWAEREDLATRYMHIYFAPNDTVPTLIEIHEEQHNVLYNSVKDMSYQPAQGFSVSGTQQIIFMNVDSFQVGSTFK